MIAVPSIGYVRPPRKLVHCSRHVRENLSRRERLLVEDARLVVVGDEDAAARQDHQERVQVVGVCALEEVEDDSRVTAIRLGEDFERGDGGTITARFTTNDENTAIRHDHRGGVPSAILQLQLVAILLPIVRSINARGSVGDVQPDAES